MNSHLFFSVFKKKKVLITGDTGFKGSWLSIWLNELGAKVYGYALPPENSNDNFVITKLGSVINHREGDIRDARKLDAYFQDVQPHFAFHLAAQSLVLKSYDEPAETFSTNVAGTVNFFEAVRKTSSVKVAVNITSDKCYQNNEEDKAYTESDPMGGKDPYSASKGCAELVTAAYYHSFFNSPDSCRIASARAGNVIGGGDRAKNRLIPDFFKAIAENKKMPVRNPDAVRPWQHVLEPLSGYLSLCAHLHLHGNKFCGGWNFGPDDNNHYSVSDIMKEIIKASGKGDYEQESKRDKPYEAQLLKLDISKAEQILKWKPVLDFKQTALFTAKGYDDETSGSDIYKKRIMQINEYVALAKAMKINWAQ